MYLRTSALRIVRLPPLANVPAQRTRRTNAFAAAMCDKTTMRPFAKLLWTLVISPYDYSLPLLDLCALQESLLFLS